MSHRAFTLIELLVVIAIIGLLSTIAVVSLSNSRSKARDAKRVADFKQIKTALDLYFDETGAYPTCGQACPATCDCVSVAYPGGSFTAMEIKPNYLSNIPVDPINTGTPYAYYYVRGYKPISKCAFGYTGLPTNYMMALSLENPTSVPNGCTTTFSAWSRNLNYLVGE